MLDDEAGNHDLMFPKLVLLFKQFLPRLYGYHLLLEPKSHHLISNTKGVIHGWGRVTILLHLKNLKMGFGVIILSLDPNRV